LALEAVHLGKAGGEGGIRTLGTLLRYNALAKRRFRPLSHLTRILWWERYISEMSGVNRNLSATFKRPGVSSHRKEKRV
jgi:hypothetical protein